MKPQAQEAQGRPCAEHAESAAIAADLQARATPTRHLDGGQGGLPRSPASGCGHVCSGRIRGHRRRRAEHITGMRFPLSGQRPLRIPAPMSDQPHRTCPQTSPLAEPPCLKGLGVRVHCLRGSTSTPPLRVPPGTPSWPNRPLTWRRPWAMRRTKLHPRSTALRSARTLCGPRSQPRSAHDPSHTQVRAVFRLTSRAMLGLWDGEEPAHEPGHLW